jgi:hypothetical protein
MLQRPFQGVHLFVSRLTEVVAMVCGYAEMVAVSEQVSP